MSIITQRIKMELWKRFGTDEHPAEWDGKLYGGGMISQRYWEYFKSIEMLDLDETSIVLDIGGGSPISGIGFFSSLLSKYVKKVIVMDKEIKCPEEHNTNVEIINEDACYENLKDILNTYDTITHISSVSVFEHIEDNNRKNIVKSINNHFKGTTFVTTLEYNAKYCFFEYQLTSATLSELFKPLTNFYLSECEASPIWCENAFDAEKHWKLRQFGRFKVRVKPYVTDSKVPLWYPLALKFLKMSDQN